MTRIALQTRIALHMAGTATLVAAVLCFDVPSSRAQYFGDAPWCAVVQIGTGGVHWDCQYTTVEACVPNVLGGNRGFCGMNPYFTGVPQRTAPVMHTTHQRWHRNHPWHHNHGHVHKH